MCSPPDFRRFMAFFKRFPTHVYLGPQGRDVKMILPEKATQQPQGVPTSLSCRKNSSMPGIRHTPCFKTRSVRCTSREQNHTGQEHKKILLEVQRYMCGSTWTLFQISGSFKYEAHTQLHVSSFACINAVQHFRAENKELIASYVSPTFLSIFFLILLRFENPFVGCRVIDAAKANAIQGSAGVLSEGEKGAHELLRTLVRDQKQNGARREED